MSDNKQYKMIPDFNITHQVTILSKIKDYNHDLLNIPYVWEKTRGKGVKVAVLDTGVAPHRDLPVKSSHFYLDIPSRIDKNGHGTFVAGQIGARGNNGTGVIGLAPDCEMLIAAVLGARGNGNVYDIVDGINWAINQGVDIINMSLGVPARAPIMRKMEEACNRAEKAGITVIAASGNEGGGIGQPAIYDSVIAVGAVDKRKRKASFSNRGDKLDFVAGGVDNYSTWINDDYVKISGTSMACPAVSSVAALIIAKHRDSGEELTPLEVKKHIKKIAFDLGPEGFDSTFGHGIPIFGKEIPQRIPSSESRGGFWDRILRFLRIR